MTGLPENGSIGEHAERKSLPELLRERRSEAMVLELEDVALRLFEELGFPNVTVEDIASIAGISVRTFYRYFPTKEDTLQVRLREGARFIRSALARRPRDESPLRSVHAALAEEAASTDPDRHGRWIRVVASNPSVLAGVMGGIQLQTQAVIREFFAERLGLPEDSMAPWIWAAAVGGVTQGANIRWHLKSGDLGQILSEGFEILEKGIAESASERRENASNMPRSRARRSHNHTGRL